MTPQAAAAIDYQAVLAEIRAEMARQRVTGQVLADSAGLAQSTISRRLNGAPFTLQEILAICSALGISLRQLLDDAEAHRSHPVSDGIGASVAGAGFEPATSGLRAPVLRLVPELTQADYELTA